jgi:hypothetical protein
MGMVLIQRTVCGSLLEKPPIGPPGRYSLPNDLYALLKHDLV